MIGRDDADGVLTRLGAAHEQLAALMYSIDAHPGLKLLRHGNVSGRTETMWRAVRPEVDLLWVHFATLGDVLERARAIRGRPHLGDTEWQELARLLGEPIVQLGPDGLPVDATTAPTSRLSVGVLAGQLERRCSAVLMHLSEMDEAWTAVAAEFVRVSEAVDAVAETATQVGEEKAGERLRAALAEVERLCVSDPVAAAPAGRLAETAVRRFADLDRAIGRARQQLDEVVRLREGYPQVRTELARLVDEIAAAEGEVARVHTLVAQKIANPGLGEVPEAATVLRARLESLDGMAKHADWSGLAARLSTVEASARAARDRARELTSVGEGLLARRAELRGRLEAYRAKAAARGLAEHGELTTLYTRAHDLLFSAPCDLRASTRAVFAYQRALAGAVGRGASSPLTAPGEGSAVDD